MSKEKLMKIIEKLLSSEINPAYIQYFELEELQNMVKTLEDKKGILSEEDKEWLMQFKSENNS